MTRQLETPLNVHSNLKKQTCVLIGTARTVGKLCRPGWRTAFLSTKAKF